jgi:chemotaxis protein histidine kinase CheA
LEEEDILLIIFKDAFSTSETITDISGRGVGLSSILHELNKLGGSLEINNNFTKGIEFKFSVPLAKI